MATATVNLTPPRTDVIGVRAGDRNTFTVRILSGGTAMDLTGYTVEAQARITPNDPASLDAVITILDAPNGLLSVSWPGDDVRTLLGGADTWKGVWDMQVTTGSEDPLTVTAGSWTADMDVTR